MFWTISALILAGLALAALAFAYITYRIAFYAPRARETDPHAIPTGEQYAARKAQILSLIDELERIPCERVYITSFDGLKLAARYYPARSGAPIAIEMHGYRSHALRDACGGDKLCREAGFARLLVDQRAHGESAGHVITFGVLERRDCLDWIRYARDRFGHDTPIVLSGVSMGAATVLMASGMELPANVVGVVADSAYTSPQAIIAKVCGDMRISATLAYPFIALGARVFGGFSLADASALDAVTHSHIPTLFVHGEADRFVPCAMGRALFSACAAPKTLLTVPDAGHGLSCMVDTGTYARTLRTFWDAVLPEDARRRKTDAVL